MNGKWFGRFLITISIITLLGCNRSKDAIELVKNAKMSGTEKTNTEWVQNDIDEGAKKNIQYKWMVEEKPEQKTFLVSFVDTVTERGYFWEADMSNKIVKFVSNNWQLKKKYGITPLRRDGNFSVENVTVEKVTIINNYLGDGIIYKVVGEIKNNTEKTITNSTLGANLIAIYSEQKIIEKSANVYGSEFSSASIKNPWKPGESRKFTVVTDPIDSIYKEYKPTDAFCFIILSAEDPLGFEYAGAIDERSLTEQFSSLN